MLVLCMGSCHPSKAPSVVYTSDNGHISYVLYLTHSSCHGINHALRTCPHAGFIVNTLSYKIISRAMPLEFVIYCFLHIVHDKSFAGMFYILLVAMKH